MATITTTQTTRCQTCRGRGNVDWGMVPSMGGVGGYVMETRRCDDCEGWGYLFPAVDCELCCDTHEVFALNADGTVDYGSALSPCPDCIGDELEVAA